MVGQVSVLNSPHLKATLLAIKTVDRDIRAEVRSQTRAVAAPAWQRALSSRAHTTMETRVLVNTARVSVSDQNIRVRSASSRKKALSGGMVPFDSGKAVEFGANRNKKTTYKSAYRGGQSFSVTRHTARQMRPARRQGYVFYPAAAEMVPRILALWTQTTVKVIGDALDGKR
jgi:hypothetical protein